MTVHVLELGGCAPQPLAHYLKALGILRLVAEQKDAGARGWWEGERFRLASGLDRKSLSTFLLEEYRPTPLVSPWNKGSGFYQQKDPALDPIASSRAPRLEPYRKAIGAARALLRDIAHADEVIRSIKAATKSNTSFQSDEQRILLKRSVVYADVLGQASSKGKEAEGKGRKHGYEGEEDVLAQLNALISPSRRPPTKQEAKAIKNSTGYKRLLAEADRRFKIAKQELIPACRRHWRGPHQDWMECATVLDQDGEAAYPSLLGTGGNDGKLDFTNKFMQRLAVIFDLSDPVAPSWPESASWLEQALFGTVSPGLLVGKDGKVGQFLPGGAGGANSVSGFGGQDDTLLNPLDYILMLEGSLLFSAALTSRGEIRRATRAAAPFAVRSQAGGYASASASDEGARGEQWMPMWDRPMGLPDLKHLMAEGRVQLGSSIAREPLDIARAVARLGTARGISEFRRYSYIERNGQSNLAVPLGRFSVPSAPRQQLSCLDDLGSWLIRLRRQARDQHAPARLLLAERRLTDACFSVAQHSGEAVRWQSVLEALAGVEAIMKTGCGFSAGPVPPLRPEWAEVADDGSPEFRLALAFALQYDDGRRGKGGVDGVRRHWLPLERGRFKSHSDGRRARLESDPGVVITGRDGITDAVALVQRRMLEGVQHGQRSLSLVSARAASSRLDDLARVVAGGVDLNRTLRLARALMAIGVGAWRSASSVLRQPERTSLIPDDGWLMVRLSILPWPLKKGAPVGCDAAIVRRLADGDSASAVHLARGRLRTAGLNFAIRGASVDFATARRWAAALAFPITPATAERMVRRLDPSYGQEDSNVR